MAGNNERVAMQGAGWSDPKKQSDSPAVNKARRGRPKRGFSFNKSSSSDLQLADPFSQCPLLPARELNIKELRYLFHKELKSSDVSLTGRIIIPKKYAELHLPTLHAKDGFGLSMDDMDGLGMWRFKFRYWPNNHSRMYVMENTGGFIRTHELHVGDYIMVYKDDNNDSYVIQAWKSLKIETKPPSKRCRRDLMMLPEVDTYAFDDLYPFASFSLIDDPDFPYYYHTDTILDDIPMQLACESLPNFPSIDDDEFLIIDDTP